jgi:hypothetical protein
MNVVGFSLSGQDNDSFMFQKHELPRCPACGYKTDFLSHNSNYVLRRKAPDYSTTYDGHYIVSERFRQFCRRQKYTGLEFGQFKNDPNHFDLQVEPVIPFDAKRRETRFIKLCQVCGNYESVVGAYPSYLKCSDPLPDGFYRSDLLFASGDEKHPVFYVGAETKEKLKRARLTGLELEPAYGLEPSIALAT